MMENLERYRNVEVQGAIGKIIFKSMPIPIELAQEIWAEGGGIPLDLTPSEYWWEGDYLRFGEEALGKDF